jgi:hypothetical protein
LSGQLERILRCLEVCTKILLQNGQNCQIAKEVIHVRSALLDGMFQKSEVEFMHFSVKVSRYVIQVSNMHCNEGFA